MGLRTGEDRDRVGRGPKRGVSGARVEVTWEDLDMVLGTSGNCVGVWTLGPGSDRKAPVLLLQGPSLLSGSQGLRAPQPRTGSHTCGSPPCMATVTGVSCRSLHCDR